MIGSVSNVLCGYIPVGLHPDRGRLKMPVLSGSKGVDHGFPEPIQPVRQFRLHATSATSFSVETRTNPRNRCFD